MVITFDKKKKKKDNTIQEIAETTLTLAATSAAVGIIKKL